MTPGGHPPRQRSHTDRAARLGWVLWGLCLLLCCLALLFLMLSVSTPLPYVSSGFRGSSIGRGTAAPGGALRD
jgi:hypothetical protein